ncbi:hypothetical protein OOU_Y34scaffold00613g7 [Pyricularia oryzae Y34]|uniref:Uncharacterized protein n=2 Tax=Pyricularia oryzae TaxID=318829 RepID=A0AA97PJQ0_PYRO3|nr:hypothetical protein OOU_Y34scaffold00613g7 [Pyricularia oryzae Y34]
MPLTAASMDAIKAARLSAASGQGDAVAP